MATMQRVGTTATTVKGGRERLEVTYHQTTVVRVDSEGIHLDSGGWRTTTTKARMNQAANQYGLGFSVFQEKGKWFVRVGNWETGETLPFVDGMVIHV